ncbi:MAG: 4-(cytidine 5'-diphospho)-2-C-methyl-D-erythritol kinase [Candidatus Margulisbacteria bacterium]|nr:4-(cytidine 5'-diphospho)-2-C-methyl-D-erythritol kinase [Candidatus Margulisiibacteriota bacterium]
MLRLKAYAKINLSLKILGLRPDKYHELDSVMQSISLCDIVTLTPIDHGIEVVTTNLRLPTDKKNLAYQAAELFLRVKGQGSGVKGVKIHIEKNIPLAAGLAGGSADAAAVLYGLNQLSLPALRVTNYALLELGAQIGSDVPFCLTGGNCTVKGRGEFVTRNPMSVNRTYIVVVPEVEVPTKWAYGAWDAKYEALNTKSETNSKYQISNSKNDLEAVVIEKYPVIQKVKDKLLSLGCSFAQMSGSGPSVFGFPADEKTVAAMKQEFPRSYLARSVDCGIEEA